MDREELILVTVSNRPALAGWVARQARDQLAHLQAFGVDGSWLVVDGARGAVTRKLAELPVADQPRFVHVHLPDGALVDQLPCGKLREAALGILEHRPSATYLAWLDDDDWFHPYRLVRMVETHRAAQRASGEVPLWGSGPTELRVWDTETDLTWVRPSGLPIFAGSLYKLASVTGLSWSSRPGGSDTDWLARIGVRARARGERFGFLSLTSGICSDSPALYPDFPALYALHRRNTGNRSRLQALPTTPRSELGYGREPDELRAILRNL